MFYEKKKNNIYKERNKTLTELSLNLHQIFTGFLPDYHRISAGSLSSNLYSPCLLFRKKKSIFVSRILIYSMNTYM